MVILLGWPIVRLASRSPVKDQVVTIFNLGEEEPVLNGPSFHYSLPLD
jgi:hypothetical protein